MTLPTVKIGERIFTILFPDLLRPHNDREERDFHQSMVTEKRVVVPIIVDENDGVIDGGHRVRYAADFGLTEIPVVEMPGLSAKKKRELALSLNANRRHLSPTERREAIQEMLRQNAGRSNRHIAEKAGVSDKTVAAVREEMVATAEIPQLTETTGKDGKARPANGRQKVATAHKRMGQARLKSKSDPIPKPKHDGIDLRDYLGRCTGTIEGAREALEEHIDQDAWDLFLKENRLTVDRLAENCWAMLELLDKVQSADPKVLHKTWFYHVGRIKMIADDVDDPYHIAIDLQELSERLMERAKECWHSQPKAEGGAE